MIKTAIFASAISLIGFVSHAEASGYCYVKEGTACRASPLGHLTSDCEHECKIGKVVKHNLRRPRHHGQHSPQ